MTVQDRCSPATRRRALALALTAAGLGTLALARPSLGSATDADVPPSVVVKYSDLDLSTAQGAPRLYQRLTIAAAIVCPGYDSGDVYARFTSLRCRRNALSRAVEALHSSEVAAVQAARQRHG